MKQDYTIQVIAYALVAGIKQLKFKNTRFRTKKQIRQVESQMYKSNVVLKKNECNEINISNIMSGV